MLVFVYGTLKKGQPNHHWLSNPQNGSSHFVAKGTTSKKYPLVIASMYNIPFLLDFCDGNTGHNIVGEIYEVDEKMLANLDILEEHPKIYLRRQIEINTDADVLTCWTYFLTNFNRGLLKLSFLSDYSGHGLQYVSSGASLQDIKELKDSTNNTEEESA